MVNTRITSFIMAVTIAFVGGRPAMITAATGAVALVIAPVAREHGLEVDVEGFEREMEAQRERGRAAARFGGPSSAEGRQRPECGYKPLCPACSSLGAYRRFPRPRP